MWPIYNRYITRNSPHYYVVNVLQTPQARLFEKARRSNLKKTPTKPPSHRRHRHQHRQNVGQNNDAKFSDRLLYPTGRLLHAVLFAPYKLGGYTLSHLPPRPPHPNNITPIFWVTKSSTRRILIAEHAFVETRRTCIRKTKP